MKHVSYIPELCKSCNCLFDRPIEKDTWHYCKDCFNDWIKRKKGKI